MLLLSDDLCLSRSRSLLRHRTHAPTHSQRPFPLPTLRPRRRRKRRARCSSSSFMSMASPAAPSFHPQQSHNGIPQQQPNGYSQQKGVRERVNSLIEVRPLPSFFFSSFVLHFIEWFRGSTPFVLQDILLRQAQSSTGV